MKHILVVDDDKTNLVSARNALGEQYKVIAVTSGAQALKYLEGNICDLILLDINMPDMDGFEVMQRIKDQNFMPEIPIVFLTADGDSDTETRCLESGARDFITKPFVPAVMVSRIGRILEMEEMRQQLTDKLERKIAEVKSIKSKSNQDALTGLWNRTYTAEQVNRIIEEGGSGALFMIDLDNFKAVNDNYGHLEGDSTLKMLAETMQKFASDGDIACRFGGDEFVMFINGKKSKSELGELASNIISDLRAKIAEKGYKTNTSVSIGIAQAPEDGYEFNKVYSAADKALYHVKQNGKNDYHFYSEQKAGEESRGATLVDLKYLKELMSRVDSGKGAYQLDLDSFNHVYNFIRRFVERSGEDVQTVLFTALTDDGIAQEEIDTALDILEQAIYSSLRRVDVSTRYSSRQIIVILMSSNTENGDLVAQRILESFENLYNGKSVKMCYDIARMEGKISK